MLVALSLVALLFGGACSFEDNDLYGISHVAFVTTDIALSRRFYTEVLGGMLVEGLSTGQEGVFGDSHYYRIFQKEIMESRSTGKSLEELGVPNIGNNGNYKVVWDFVLLSNTLIQLMTFMNRNNNQVYVRTYRYKGNAFVNSAHTCLFADDRVIPLQQMQDILDKQNQMPGYPENNKGFISLMPVESFAMRRNIGPSGSLFPLGADFQLAMMRGPMAERWEIAYRRGTGLVNDLAMFCTNKGVFPLLLDTPPLNRYQDSPSKRYSGLSHTNVVTDDYGATVNFYTRVLGGKMNPLKSGTGIPIDPGFQAVIFQDEELEAREQGDKPNEFFGIIEAKTGASQGLFDIGFILFDNFYMEPYRYHMNASYTSVPPYLYREQSSPAYTNNLHTGFWVKDDVDMATFIKKMESDSRTLGLRQVIANRAVDVTRRPQSVSDDQYSDPFPEGHRLAGYDYTYFKGPSGEALVLAKFLGRARQTLKAAMEKYGTVSTAYDSTNPWRWDGFAKKCKFLEDQAQAGQ